MTSRQPTTQEEAYRLLVDKKYDLLSEAARTALDWAQWAGSKSLFINMVSTQQEEFEGAATKTREAAAKFTHQDHELLAEIARAARSAGDSIDPDDETFVQHRIQEQDFHFCYAQIRYMIEMALRE